MPCKRSLSSFLIGCSWQLKKVLLPFNHPLKNLDIPPSATTISWWNSEGKQFLRHLCGSNHRSSPGSSTQASGQCPDSKPPPQTVPTVLAELWDTAASLKILVLCPWFTGNAQTGHHHHASQNQEQCGAGADVPECVPWWAARCAGLPVPRWAPCHHSPSNSTPHTLSQLT